MFFSAVYTSRVFCVALAPVVSSTAATAATCFQAGATDMTIRTAVRALSRLFNEGLNVVPRVPDGDVGR